MYNGTTRPNSANSVAFAPDILLKGLLVILSFKEAGILQQGTSNLVLHLLSARPPAGFGNFDNGGVQ